MDGVGLFVLTTLQSNSQNSTVTVTTLLQGGFYSLRFLEVLSSGTGCFTLPLFKAGQVVQQWVASSSLLAGAGWWAERVIGRENSDCLFREQKFGTSPVGMSWD